MLERGLGGVLNHTRTCVVRGRDKVVTDGPYAESKDLMTGVLVIDVATLAAVRRSR